MAPFAMPMLAWLGCNETAPYETPPEELVRVPRDEVCDRVDNDLDGLVDEAFKNDAGVYVHDDHCGRCRAACIADAVTRQVRCEVTEDGPACRAVACIDGYVPGGSATCVPWGGWLCLPCLDDGECGGFDGARCAEVAGEPRCTVDCIDGTCPRGYLCEAGRCEPPSKSCSCGSGDRFTVSCAIDVGGEPCLGESRCENGVLTPCAGTAEVCDGVDNNCDGVIDEPFVDDAGRYTTDIHHCGACGVDCTLNQVVDFEITCGGPSLQPVCAIVCEDVLDGIHAGDRVDADLMPETGCECAVQRLDDLPDADDPAEPERLDANCDGADGVVEESFYVVPTGNDDDSGTPTAPFGTIQGAVDAAVESLTTTHPRPYIFVAAGVYPETLWIKNGIHIYGGYRPDFLARDPAAYATELHAPSWSDSPGGAALVAKRDTGVYDTAIDGVAFRGASAPSEAGYAFGAYLDDPGPALSVTRVSIRAGDGADGENGEDGSAGDSPPEPGQDGMPQKVAAEDAGEVCLDNAQNISAGGAGGGFICDGAVVSGGAGGSSGCAVDIDHSQPAGDPGHSPGSAVGGTGGSGGFDAVAPIVDNGVTYCGLADFIVSSAHQMAGDGSSGENGESGLGGAGCDDPVGRLSDGEWFAAGAAGGAMGGPGAGGGGGGAGGSVVIDGVACGFADGIGGGGGGGGAGGCGGDGGMPGTSGGPSVGVVLVVSDPNDAPVLDDLTIITGMGGDGGSGGHGGDGGQGGAGGSGGALAPTERTIPSLSGPDEGGHGGAGGAGGRGGGGGGGCGGSTIGVWITGDVESAGPLADEMADRNTFLLGASGAAGSHGVGGAGGTSGRDGGGYDVFVR